jgi:transcriptional regulator GlxA family with amidase domain
LRSASVSVIIATSKANSDNMTKLAIWALGRGLATGIAAPVDVLTVANAVAVRQGQPGARPLFRWSVQSPDGGAVRTAAGVTLHADGALDPDGRVDVVFLPGLFIESTGPELWRELKRHEWLLPALRKQHERGTVIAANCTSTLLLAEAGLLDGRVATTSWWLARTFERRYPAVVLRVHQAVTQDGGIFCSGASTAGIQLALRLVEKFASRGVAMSTAKTLLVEGSRGLQAPYQMLASSAHAHDDALVLRAQRWIERRLGEPFDLPALAQAIAVSERTVIRRFKTALGDTPGRYAQSLKVQSAKQLLETRALSWEAVCERVGYSDPSSFRRLFKREVGVSPGRYQERFSALGREPKTGAIRRSLL